MKGIETTLSSLSESLPDVHSEKPAVELYLTRVGIKNYRVKVTICSGDCEAVALTMSMHVDLPGNLRGVHVSRFIEVVEALAKQAHNSIPEFLRRVVDAVLDKHEYATRAEIHASFEHVLEGGEVVSAEYVVVKARAELVEEVLRVSFTGVTACPCVQRVYSYVEKCPLESTPTHLQRSVLTITVKSSNPIQIDPLEVYRVCRRAFSNTLASKLKRLEEYAHIKQTIGNPRFVEDVARIAVKLFVEAFSSVLRDSDKLAVEVDSFESIHVFDTHASVENTIAEFKRELGINR